MLENTQPTRRLDQFQPMRALPAPKRKPSRIRLWILIILLFLYFLGPFRINILLLGTDDSPQRGAVRRTDTIILTTLVPTLPYAGMLWHPNCGYQPAVLAVAAVVVFLGTNSVVCGLAYDRA